MYHGGSFSGGVNLRAPPGLPHVRLSMPNNYAEQNGGDVNKSII
jgi:hypothetical protein